MSSLHLHHSRGVPALGGVPQLVAAHHVRQACEAEHQVLLLLVLQVDDVGEVSEAGGAVGGVEAPVEVLTLVIIRHRYWRYLNPRPALCWSSGCRKQTQASWALRSSVESWSPPLSSSRPGWRPSSSASESWPASCRKCRRPSSRPLGLCRQTAVSL